MFLRLNRTNGSTNIFNLDNIANVWIDDKMVAFEFVGANEEEGFKFSKERNPKEYEQLKSFFGSRFDAHTINA